MVKATEKETPAAAASADVKEAVEATITEAVGSNANKLRTAVAAKVAAWEKGGGLTKAIAAGITAVVRAVKWFIRNFMRVLHFIALWAVCPIVAVMFWLFSAGVDGIAAIQRKLANRKATKAVATK